MTFFNILELQTLFKNLKILQRDIPYIYIYILLPPSHKKWKYIVDNCYVNPYFCIVRRTNTKTI